MKAKTPPPNIVGACTGLLAPYVPGITPEKLVEAIRNLDMAKKPAMPPSAQPLEYLTIRQAAQRLKCCEKQIRILLSRGELTRARIGKRGVRIPAGCLARLEEGGLS